MPETKSQRIILNYFERIKKKKKKSSHKAKCVWCMLIRTGINQSKEDLWKWDKIAYMKDFSSSAESVIKLLFKLMLPIFGQWELMGCNSTARKMLPVEIQSKESICYLFLKSSSVFSMYSENIKLPVSPMVLCTTLQIHFAVVKITNVMQLTFLHNLSNKSKSTVKYL